MFTGIIKNTGTIKKKDAKSLEISVPKVLVPRLKLGASVAVNGACLTVAARKQNAFFADILPETWKRTMFLDFTAGDVVNLEFPLSAKETYDGHFVQGHVDGTAKLLDSSKKGKSRLLTFGTTPAISRYLVEKGSVAVNGISLTLIEARGKTFSVGIIPHTWEHTNLKDLAVGERVNIEVDILAKYAEKLNKK